MNYLIGDLQGCCDALERLLAKVGFSPSRDHAYLLGDPVNRGPQSLGTLRLLTSLGDSASCLLGNHDLHLLAVAHGVRSEGRRDTLGAILAAPDRPALLEWLRTRHLAMQANGWLMVHAGVPPQWTAAETVAHAGEVERELRGPDPASFLNVMYGNKPTHWRDSLTGEKRLRFIVNALTRTRYCNADGDLDFSSSESVDKAPAGLVPWFEVPGRKTAGVPIAFGHWSTLGLIDRPDLLALDTGCVWGGKLSAMRVDGTSRELIQVECDESQPPGK